MRDAEIIVDRLQVSRDGRPVLHEFSLSVKPGTINLLVGHNGSGKSTLLQAMFGLLPVDAGFTRFGNKTVPEGRPRELIASGVRYLAQGRRNFGRLRVSHQRRVLSQLYRFPMNVADPYLLTSHVPNNARSENLSVGEQRLEALAMLSVGKPSIFLLDEPMSGLDASWRKLIVEFIANWGHDHTATFLIAEHQLRELSGIADTAFLMQDGDLVDSVNEPCIEERLFQNIENRNDYE